MEFDKIAEYKPELNPKTLVGYHNLYKRLKAVNPKIDITELSNEQIMASIDKIKPDDRRKNSPDELTPATKISLLSVAIVLKEAFGLDVTELKEAVTRTRKELSTYTAEVTNPKLQESLPSLDELKAFTEKYYEKGKWRPYLMNWLMINYGVRNKDLNIEFGNTKTVIEPNKNYLIYTSKGVKYIRGDYKTHGIYGDKAVIITDKNVMKAVKQIMGTEGDDKFLLSVGANKQVADSSMGKYIARYTLNEMGQGRIFKVLLNAQPKKLEKLAASRGTAVSTVLNFYDINHEDHLGNAKKETEKVMAVKPDESEVSLVVVDDPKPKKIRIKRFKIVSKPKKLLSDQITGGLDFII